jgi:hypothetical protein
LAGQTKPEAKSQELRAKGKYVQGLMFEVVKLLNCYIVEMRLRTRKTAFDAGESIRFETIIWLYSLKAPVY